MPPLNHHDPHSNRFLLLSIFVFAALLLYLTTHRPESSLRSSSSSIPSSVLPHGKGPRLPSPATSSVQKPLVVDIQGSESGIIQHRIVAIGDIHGDFTALTKILRKAELIDLKGQWIGGETILVQTGDIVDRGVDTIACYKFMQTLRALAEKSGGAVVSLLGNHEIMNALGDWRYVNQDDIKSFGGERNRREAMSTGWIGQEWRTNYSITARVPFLSKQFPTTSSIVDFPRRTSKFGPDRSFTAEPVPFLEASSNELDKDGAVSFVHGGIIPEYLATFTPLQREHPISTINEIGQSLMDSLVAEPGHAYPISLPRTATPEQRLFWSEKGVMWNRDWALLQEREICHRVDQVLRTLRVRRLVMGHTPHFEGIVSRCKGKVLLIDTGISRAYGGAHSFLEISHTLRPYSRGSSISDDDDDQGEDHDAAYEQSYNEVLVLERDDVEEEGRGGTSRWVEHEVIKAVYEYRENGSPGEETLVDFKRTLNIH